MPSCFPGWICSLKCFPSPPLSPNGRLYCVWLGLHSKGKARLHTAGEAEAAEPSTHNGALREGEGKTVAARLLGAWEQEWWEQGRDKREAGKGENAGSCQRCGDDEGNEDIDEYGECCGALSVTFTG